MAQTTAETMVLIRGTTEDEDMVTPDAGSARPTPYPGPSGMPSAGSGAVGSGAATSDLAAQVRELRTRPLSEHADTYDEIHAALDRSLAEIDTR